MATHHVPLPVLLIVSVAGMCDDVRTAKSAPSGEDLSACSPDSPAPLRRIAQTYAARHAHWSGCCNQCERIGGNTAVCLGIAGITVRRLGSTLWRPLDGANDVAVSPSGQYIVVSVGTELIVFDSLLRSTQRVIDVSETALIASSVVQNPLWVDDSGCAGVGEIEVRKWIKDLRRMGDAFSQDGRGLRRQ
jgi:hypothetical protein